MKKFYFTLIILLAPVFTFAANPKNLRELISVLIDAMNALIPALLGLGVIGVMWGVIKYLYAGGNPEKLKEARNYIIFSIIAIAVMMSVWGLASMVKGLIFDGDTPLQTDFRNIPDNPGAETVT